MKSLGIDTSVTRTGIAVTAARAGKLELIHKESVKGEGHGILRAYGIAAKVADLIFTHEPDVIVIEGYAYGNAYSLATLVEVGTLVRWGILSAGKFYLDPSPKTVKKFITGYGSASKKHIVKACKTRWGVDKVNHDEADALGMSAMGLAYMGALPHSDAELEILMTCKKHSLALAS